jgi:hypothetical protein
MMKPKYKLRSGRVLNEAEAMARGDSFDAIRSRVAQAINTQIRKGNDMDLDGDGDADINDWAYVEDMYPGTAIYCMNGRLFAVDYTDGDAVALGTPVAVEISYTPVKESQRLMVIGSSPIRETAYNASTGKLTITVIKPGFNTSKSRYYKESTLKRDHQIFEGAKMFVNHATAQEDKNRPEGDVNQWVASVGRTWTESDGTVMAEADVIDPPFKAKLERLAEVKKLGEMGVSIRAIGESYNGEIEGHQTAIVESFIAARSVDFVTYPGAGGRVEAIEADDVASRSDIELVTETQLRSRRPDLVLLVESKLRENFNVEKTLAQVTQELKEANEKNATLTAQITEADKKTKKSETATTLDGMLKESNLPDQSKDRLKKRFAEALTTDGMKEAIADEKEYLKQLGVKEVAPAVTKVTKLGESTTGDGGEKKVDLTESFKRLGLSDEEAKIAAAGKR